MFKKMCSKLTIVEVVIKYMCMKYNILDGIKQTFKGKMLLAIVITTLFCRGNRPLFC